MRALSLGGFTAEKVSQHHPSDSRLARAHRPMLYVSLVDDIQFIFFLYLELVLGLTRILGFSRKSRATEC
jgi:hypothetical protein